MGVGVDGPPCVDVVTGLVSELSTRFNSKHITLFLLGMILAAVAVAAIFVGGNLSELDLDRFMCYSTIAHLHDPVFYLKPKK